MQRQKYRNSSIPEQSEQDLLQPYLANSLRVSENCEDDVSFLKSPTLHLENEWTYKKTELSETGKKLRLKCEVVESEPRQPIKSEPIHVFTQTPQKCCKM